ncbi:MAG: type II toxin-antitoxin system RelE/ParE family toxin [Nitrospira sp.]|nr:type II toxin-antitoxin system RelE/ParE family toxin [Nitrospira sp.]TKB73809.1 MAG: type II toxin-antitoxin system RelE/ParE family toxin [Nitrospira sp.]
MKPVHFMGSSREDMRELPEDAKETAGHQLFKVQQGKEPDDWKPIPTVGPGVNEIRVRDESGAYRVLYLAKFEEAVYVLHVFEKRSQKIPKGDIQLAKGRYTDLLKWRKEQDL